MQNENNRADVEMVKDLLLEKMRSIVTDKDGKVAPGFEEAFEGYQQDDQGNPVLQTVAGMVYFDAEGLVDGVIRYSPNLGVDGESLAAEVVDVSMLLSGLGYKLVVCTGHYVDYQGQVSYGDEARKVKRHIETTVILQQIQQMQKEKDSQPRLILPESKIVTR